VSESPASDRFADLKPGALLDELDASIKALVGVDSLGSYGGIRTLDNAPQPTDIDDIGEYAPGIDQIENLAVAESLASGRAMAYKGRSEEQPRAYHTVVEYGDRYLSSTGQHSLHALARVALATVTLAAQSESAELNLHAAREGERPLEIHDEIVQGVWTLKQYDDYTREPGEPLTSGDTGEALAEGLNGVLLGESLEENSDVCVVISDFLGGAQYSQSGALRGFNWQSPLRQLHSALGDRLLIARLTTQAQRELPFARTLAHQGKATKLDVGDYLRISDRYRQLADQKAQSTQAILRGMRLLELDAGDKTPLVTVPKFVFARQEAVI
jgi:hypothetical protein